MENEKWLIDANEALKELCKYCSCGCYEECETRCVEFRNISRLPRVDAVEVVHGRWIKFQFLGYEPTYECSACGKLHDQDYNFCNNCGAKMDGGSGE